MIVVLLGACVGTALVAGCTVAGSSQVGWLLVTSPEPPGVLFARTGDNMPSWTASAASSPPVRPSSNGSAALVGLQGTPADPRSSVGVWTASSSRATPADRWIALATPGCTLTGVADGWGLVVHSAVVPGGLATDRVAVPTGSVLGTVAVSPTLGFAFARVRDDLWINESAVSRASLARYAPIGVPARDRIRVFARDGAVRTLTAAPEGIQIVVSDGSRIFAAIGPHPWQLPAGSRTPPSRVVELSPSSGAVRRSAPLGGLDRVASRGVAAAGRLALLAWDGLDPADPGHRVVALDADSLRPAWARDVEGAVDLATDGSTLWVLSSRPAAADTTVVAQVDGFSLADGTPRGRLPLPGGGSYSGIAWIADH